MKKSAATVSTPSRKSVFGIFNLLLLVVLVIYASIVYYVYQLEQMSDPPCDCSKDWRRDYIKWYFIFIFLYVVITTLIGFRPKPRSLLTAILSILLLVQIYALFTYIRDLKGETECKCATELDLYKVGKYYSWIQVSVLALLVVVAIFIAVMRVLVFRKVK